jgi:hypothetical protein
MNRTILFFMATLLVTGPAAAQDTDAAAGIAPWLSHLAITAVGLFLAAYLAWDAFGRAVPIVDLPTFPRYMTNRQQYRLGGAAFVLFACGVFLLLVYNNRAVFQLTSLTEIIPEGLLKAANEHSPSYLVVITAVAAIYLYFLTVESRWNVLLIMRDVIHGWISVPHLANQIIAQIRYAFHISPDAIAQVIASMPKVVVEQDFRKDPATADRMWAEICYMRWWLTQGRAAGADATFFTEKSFGYDNLKRQFKQAAWTMEQLKSGKAEDLDLSQFTQTIQELHTAFARLAACYLIYRNGNKEDLREEAKGFGVGLGAPPPGGNPLRYWIIYFTALSASVWLGVFFSAVIYDWLDGKGINLAQDSGRMVAWLMYSICNYGLAIVVVLLLRMTLNSLRGGFAQSHLTTYCWSFLAAFLVGPLGLTLALHFFGQGIYQTVPLPRLYFETLRWGLGPALVSVYITYYLDKELCEDLPNNVAALSWRLLNCFGFAAAVVFLLLPPLLTIPAQAEATWEVAKLRFIATGTTFAITLGLALAAQFGLGKQASAPGGPAAAPLNRRATPIQRMVERVTSEDFGGTTGRPGV